jgi:phage shock protein C
MLGGVAAGLAEYLGVDPSLMRLGFVIALVLGHVLTLVLYIAAWLIIPERPLFD